MAHLYRVAFALVLLGFVALAHASFAPRYPWYYSNSSPAWRSTPEAACADLGPGAYFVPPSQCGMPWAPGQLSSLTVSGTPSCPANSTLSGGQCSCSTGYKESGASCVVDGPTPTAVCTQASIDHHTWGSSSSSVYPGRIEDGSSTCYVPYPESSPAVGCSISFEMDVAWQNDNGSWSTRGRYVADLAGTSGIPCVPGGSSGPDPTPENPKAEPQPSKCASGYQGTVNGVSVCVPNVTNAGVDYVPKITVDETESQRVEVTSSTHCTAGKCTTTTTTKTTDKSSGTSSTSTSSQTVSDAQFCASNPSSCSGGRPAYGGNGSDDDEDSEKSSFGGSCSGGFTCQGDAIQCAMAREQHKRNCTVFDDTTSPEYQAYTAAKSVTGKVTDSLEGNRTFDVGALITGTTDQFLAGRGTCPANRVIQGPNWRLEIPYSTICPYLEILGNIFVVLSSLAAIRILTRRG